MPGRDSGGVDNCGPRGWRRVARARGHDDDGQLRGGLRMGAGTKIGGGAGAKARYAAAAEAALVEVRRRVRLNEGRDR